MSNNRMPSNSVEIHTARERGSALIIALMVMIIMTLLGLSFLIVGETETKIARNQRDAAQAGFVAEGGVRMVRAWFEAPSGSSAFNVPTISQMDRTLRYVDDNNDGTYGAYASATAPYNVIYRSGTDDPFEKPYRGSPALMFLGTEDHPDLRISASGSSNEQTFLTTINSALYPAFPSVGTRARIRQIDVYSPPMISISGVRTRYGIATIKVTADVYQNSGTAQETRVATKTVRAVLNEVPYPGPGGPLQSCKSLDFTGNAKAHWGTVSAVDSLTLHSNLTSKADSSIPWFDSTRIIARDMNQDGTLSTLVKGTPSPDDQDGNGTYDFDTWVSAGNVEDPWLRFMTQGTFTNAPTGCTGIDCIPLPWFTSPSTFTNSDDHSNIVQHASKSLCPQFDYSYWKQIAQGGGRNVYYYASDGAGTGTYRLGGAPPSVTFDTAVANGAGLYFFDTATNSVPVDADSNGVYDNLASPEGNDGPLQGFIFLNADFNTTGAGSSTVSKTMTAPAEPYIDSNNNGKWDAGEYYIDLTYPGSPTGTWVVNGGTTAGTRQDPSVDVGTAGKYTQDVSLYGVIYTNGTFSASGNWSFFGSVIAKGGPDDMSGNPDFFFDERLIKGNWPPADMEIPKTIITSWQTDL